MRMEWEGVLWHSIPGRQLLPCFARVIYGNLFENDEERRLGPSAGKDASPLSQRSFPLMPRRTQTRRMAECVHTHTYTDSQTTDRGVLRSEKITGHTPDRCPFQ